MKNESRTTDDQKTGNNGKPVNRISLFYLKLISITSIRQGRFRRIFKRRLKPSVI